MTAEFPARTLFQFAPLSLLQPAPWAMSDRRHVGETIWRNILQHFGGRNLWQELFYSHADYCPLGWRVLVAQLDLRYFHVPRAQLPDTAVGDFQLDAFELVSAQAWAYKANYGQVSGPASDYLRLLAGSRQFAPLKRALDRLAYPLDA